MSTLLQLTDANLNAYVNGLSIPDLQLFSNELNNNFDSAVTSRFSLTSSQSLSLSLTPIESKQSMANGINSLSTAKANGYTGTFTGSGFDPVGTGAKPLSISVKVEIHYDPNTGHWTIEVTITWSKSAAKV